MTEERLQKIMSVQADMKQAQKLLERFTGNKFHPERKLYIGVCIHDTKNESRHTNTDDADKASITTQGTSISGKFAELVFEWIKEIAETYYNDKKKEFESL